MQTRPLTRRTFVAGCAATGAVTALGAAQVGVAFAEGGHIGPEAHPQTVQAHSVCQACPNACAFTAFTVDGKLGKVIGSAFDPNAAGTLCARGFGYTQSAISKNNLANPLKKKDDGTFRTIGWDEAFAEIGDVMRAIIDEAGSGSVGLICDGALPTALAYGTRFMHALGSGNVWIDGATRNIGKEAAFAQVIGVGSYSPDLAHADLALLVDTSYADVVTPNVAAALQALRDAGKPIIAIDPRLGTVASFADDWFAVNPGSELALLLALCNHLIRTERYDKAFLAANATGFEEWAQAIDEFTPIWAEAITGVPSYRIEELASRLSEAAPHVAIEYNNGDIAADSYTNSSQTARVVCLLNALLGTWNMPGGALLPFDYVAYQPEAVLPQAGPDAAHRETVPTIVSFPLGAPFGASAAATIHQAQTGSLKAMLVIEADMAYDHACMPDVDRALEGLDLMVCVSQQMTQTATLADYVLPLCPYLSCGSLPVFSQGTMPVVSIATAAIGSSDSNALPIDAIIEGLARACDVGDAFASSLDEVASAQLSGLKLTIEGVRDAGSVAVPVEVPRVASWPTPSHAIQFVSIACEQAGVAALPLWTPLEEASNITTVASDDVNDRQRDRIAAIVADANGPLTFNLITGQQPVIGQGSANVAELMDIAEQYDLDSVWINADVAAVLDIETGDTIALSNDRATCQAKAFVTHRIVPTALYLPSCFGHAAERQRVSFGKGVNPLIFANPVIEEGYGILCTQGACVTLLKEGA